MVADIPASGATSLRAMAGELNARGMLTRRGGRWHVSTVMNLLDRLGMRDTRDVPPAEKPCDLQARMFFPGSSGLIEDPATGSATVAAAALLAELDSARDGELKLTIGQGFDMGRPSLLLTRVRKQNGSNISAHVGGACVQMMEGTFKLEGAG